jgi:hypothetical protein
VEGTGLVLLVRAILLRRLHRLHRRLHLQVIWEVVVAVVGGMAVDLRLQGSGIANEGCLCFVVRQGDLHGPSLVLGEYFQLCLHPRSWCVQ